MIQSSSIEALAKNMIDASIMQDMGKDHVSYVCDAFYQYQMAHCYNPRKVFVYDTFTGRRVEREVPCGNCYYCRLNKINEWVTRCYAHLHDFKNAYFITLTYKPYYDRTSDLNLFMMNKLSCALFHWDNLNEYQRFGYSPCILCKKHYQDFFKRLRRYTGYDDLTYIVSGEYGSEFGRPHFHILLFSNHTITRDQIRRAWSFAVVHNADGSVSPKTNQNLPYYWERKPGQPFYVYHPIGRVDFNDLVDNGTISNEQIYIDGKPMSAHNCFSYVCKYIVKGSVNEKRVKLAYNVLYSIYQKYKENANTISFPNSTPVEAVRLERDFNDYVFSRSLYVPTIEFLFKRTRPDSYLVSGNRYRPGLTLCISDPYFCYDFAFETKYRQFLSLFGCFVCPSRGCPIGSLYVKTHLQEMVNGNYPKPKFQTQGYVVPKYFMSKVDEYIYSLRLRNSKGNAVKGCLASSDRLFNFEHDDNIIIKSCITNCKDTPLSQLLNSSYSFTDLYTKERMLIRYWELSTNNYSYRVFCYRYSRKLRKYQYTRSMTLETFKKYYFAQYSAYYERHQLDVALYEKNQAYRAQVESILGKLGVDYYSCSVATKKVHDTNIATNRALGVSPIVPPLDIDPNKLNFDNLCREAIAHLEDNVKNHNKHLSYHKTTDQQ